MGNNWYKITDSLEDLNVKPGNVSLKKAGTYYMLGTLVNKGISLITIPIFTRILSTYDYGIVSTYNSWLAIIGIMIGCALYMGIRLAFLDYAEKIDDVMSTIVTYTIAAGFVFATLYAILSGVFGVGYGLELGLICIIHGTALMLVEDFSMYLQMKYRYKERTLLLTLPNIIAVTIAFFLIKYVMTEDLYMGRILPTAFIYVVSAFFIVILVYKKSRCFFNKGHLGYCVKISLPLVFHAIALNILGQSDRIMLTGMYSASAAGIYSLIYNYGTAATVVTTGFQGVWDPWLLNNMKDEKYEEINEMSKKYMVLISYAVVSIIMIGPEVVKILASSVYWEGISIIPPIVLANYAIFVYSFFVSIEHYYKKTTVIAVNTFVAAGINLILNYIFIPRFGYVAAAYTTVAGYVVCLILHIFYSRQLDDQLFPLKMFVAPLMQVVVSSVVYYFFIDNPWMRWGLLVMYTVVLLFVYKTTLMQFFPRLKKVMRMWAGAVKALKQDGSEQLH